MKSLGVTTVLGDKGAFEHFAARRPLPPFSDILIEFASRVSQALLGDKDSQAMRITSDPRTNSLLASGSREQLEMIEAVLARLDLPDEKSKQPRRSEEQIKEIKDRVALAETELQICQDRFAWSERMVKKGFLSASQVLAEKLRLQYAEMALARAKRELQDLSPERIKEPRQNPGN